MTETVVLGKGILGINASGSGPSIGVICNVHGNEVCGRRAVHRILKNHKILKGRFILVDANPDANLVGRRFIDSDMNRMFTTQTLAEGKPNRELERARYLAEILPGLGMDHVVDFHSTSSKTRYPFVISFPGTEYLAALCPMPRIFGWKGLVAGTLIEWLCDLNTPAIVVEAGQHEAEASVNHSERTLLSVLSHYGLINPDETPTQKPQREFDVSENVQIRDTSTFRFEREYLSFDRLKPGEIIARDKVHTYQVPDENGYSILMPTSIEALRGGTAAGAYYLMKKRPAKRA